MFSNDILGIFTALLRVLLRYFISSSKFFTPVSNQISSADLYTREMGKMISLKNTIF